MKERRKEAKGEERTHINVKEGRKEERKKERKGVCCLSFVPLYI
jgi:hypothetical protein